MCNQCERVQELEWEVEAERSRRESLEIELVQLRKRVEDLSEQVVKEKIRLRLESERHRQELWALRMQSLMDDNPEMPRNASLGQWIEAYIAACNSSARWLLRACVKAEAVVSRAGQTILGYIYNFGS